MSSLQDRIAQFRKMTTDDPENELGHFRLGQLLTDAGDHAEAVKSYEKALELSPQFSKVYQLMGECYLKLNESEKAIEILKKGYQVADERGDKMPRDAMGQHLAKLGIIMEKSAAVEDDGVDTGFRCARPGCMFGKKAVPLPSAPIAGEIGLRIQKEICAGCWNEWLKNYSIKVVNELRLDLSSEFGHKEYDKYMREFFGFEETPAT
jgi:tetratricopeptide (TPR) repeat protein